MTKRSLWAVALVAAGVALSIAPSSEAEQSFTLAMTDAARKKWEDKLNGVLTEPFSKVAACTGDAKMNLSLGDGCVEAASADICCERWAIEVACSDKGRWEQKSIQGSSCEHKPRKKDE